MNIKLKAVQRDTGIQTRAEINMETVNAYADSMTEGAKFPPVVLFGTESKCWIGDGWHRVMAAEQIGALDINAELRAGGRIDALKFALAANAAHGLRRSNADKRRCVEIAVREFSGLSDNAIAQMCGVSNHAVKAARPVTLENIQPEKRTGADGKQYPATRKAATSATFNPIEDADDGDDEAESIRNRPPDPRSGRVEIDADGDERDHPTMAGLKRYWRQASKKQKRDFLAWCERN